MERRDLLKGGLVLVATATAASIYKPAPGTTTLVGGKHWPSSPLPLPEPVEAGPLVFLSADQAKLVGAIFDRLIPADDVSVGAVEAGCVTFLDHQLAGPYGKGTSRYTLGPFQRGTPEQGNQSPMGPAAFYRHGLPELAACVQETFEKPFTDLSPAQQDTFLESMESGKARFRSIPSDTLFALLLQNVKEGYLADPIYGGNKDMAGWKMIGFPGARYDYRAFVDRKGEDLGLAPISLIGRI
jgi:gluconate 2-dehydrogenase gamma chain